MERANIADGALERLIGEYTREAGCASSSGRFKVCSQGRTRSGRGTTAAIKITRRTREVRGAAQGQSEVAGGSEVGVATGLAWTPVGGDIMFIEAIQMPGRGRSP